MKLLYKLIAGFFTKTSPPAILCLLTSSTKTEAQIFAQHSQTKPFLDFPGEIIAPFPLLFLNFKYKLYKIQPAVIL